MRYLLRIVLQVIETYTCTLVQDVADKRTYPLFSNMRHTKIQVRGEKEILHHDALWARTSLDVMAVIQRDLDAENNDTTGEVVGITEFDALTRAMEEDEDSEDEIHHMIVRYCTDVLGAIRREELKKVRRNGSVSNTNTFMDL